MKTALCHHTHIYIYQIGLFKFRLLVRQWDKWPITLSVGINYTGTFVLPSWCYLYYHAANINHHLYSVVTNNLNLKGPTCRLWDMWLYDWHSAVSYPPISALKRLIFFSELWKKKKVFKICHIFMGWCIVYYIVYENLFSIGRSFQPYIIYHALLQYIFW